MNIESFKVFVIAVFSWTHMSGQIMATSHDLTPNGGLVREISSFREIWVGEILWFDQTCVVLTSLLELCFKQCCKTPCGQRGFNELREICDQWKKKQLTQADDGLENLDAWVQDLLEELQHVQCSVCEEICENIILSFILIILNLACPKI